MEHTTKTLSLWAPVPRPDFPALGDSTNADVVIVGAGIAGLTTAYRLCREGQSVVVLEAGSIASGESERTTAHLASALDDRFTELERLHGPHGARLAAESHAVAIDEIERIVAAEKIDCGFERLDGYLFTPPGASTRILNEELAAAQRAGLREAELVPRVPWPSFDTSMALLFPRQAQVHPVRYLAALARAITRDGGRIFAHSPVESAEGGFQARVRTREGHTVNASAVVLATNTPINDRVVLHAKQAAYRTYVIGVPVPRGLVPKALYWDTADPYHYVRLASSPRDDANSELLIVGGEDHRTGQADDTEARYLRLQQWARERFPTGEIMYRWSGQILEPADSLAFIGRNPMDTDNVYVATGDSGHGMTHGTIAGLLLSDLIMGRENPWAALYDPSRITPRGAVEYLKEGTNIAAQYTRWLTRGEVKTEAQIAPGSGAVLRRGPLKLAVYRDEHGSLHECSAICPHLGGIVRWNHAEKSWDCPVHGSRFDYFGKVVNGPAKRDLAPLGKTADAGQD